MVASLHHQTKTKTKQDEKYSNTENRDLHKPSHLHRFFRSILIITTTHTLITTDMKQATNKMSLSITSIMVKAYMAVSLVWSKADAEYRKLKAINTTSSTHGSVSTTY